MRFVIADARMLVFWAKLERSRRTVEDGVWVICDMEITIRGKY